MTQNKLARIDKIYSILLPFCLIWSAYSFTFMKGISLDYVFLSIFSFCFLLFDLKNHRPIKDRKGPLALIILYLIQTLLIFATRNYVITAYTLFFIAKTLVWAISLAISSKHLDKTLFLKSIVAITLLSTIYLFVQSFLYYILSIKLPNGFNLGIITFDTINASELSLNYYRPCSFFSEPAYYAISAIAALTIVLFSKTIYLHRKSVAAVLILGTLLSASTAGLYLLALLLIFYLFRNGRPTKKEVLIIITCVLPFTLIATNFEQILLHTGSIGSTLHSSIYKINNYQTSSRIGGSYANLADLSGKELLFGHGLGNEYYSDPNNPYYMNALTRLILQTGLIGLSIFTAYILKLFLSSSNILSKYLLIVIIIKCLTANMLFSSAGIFVFSLFYFIDANPKLIISKDAHEETA